jgi:hypothetical protein
MTTTSTGSGIVAGLLAVLIGVAGCGGVTDARVAARDKASKAACDRAKTCGTIGAGLEYEDYPSCISEMNGYIDDQVWPASQCQDIKQDMLNVCLNAIGGTQCGNLINLIVTLGTCSAANVCALPPASDGGGG